jgi:hypothetical protein
MTFVIVLNASLCGAVFVGIVAPLVWAILTQQRDEPAAITALSMPPRAPADAARRTRRQRQHAPVSWPAR